MSEPKNQEPVHGDGLVVTRKKKTAKGSAKVRDNNQGAVSKDNLGKSKLPITDSRVNNGRVKDKPKISSMQQYEKVPKGHNGVGQPKQAQAISDWAKKRQMRDEPERKKVIPVKTNQAMGNTSAKAKDKQVITQAQNPKKSNTSEVGPSPV